MVNAAFGRQLPDVLQRPEFKPYAHIHGMGRGHKNSPRPREILTRKESYICLKYGLCEFITADATQQYHQYAPELDFKRMVFERAVNVVIHLLRHSYCWGVVMENETSPTKDGHMATYGRYHLPQSEIDRVPADKWAAWIEAVFKARAKRRQA